MVYVYGMPSIPSLSDAQDRLIFAIAQGNAIDQYNADPRTFTALEKKGMIRQQSNNVYGIYGLTPKGRNYITARRKVLNEGFGKSQGD